MCLAKTLFQKKVNNYSFEATSRPVFGKIRYCNLAKLTHKINYHIISKSQSHISALDSTGQFSYFFI